MYKQAVHPYKKKRKKINELELQIPYKYRKFWYINIRQIFFIRLFRDNFTMQGSTLTFSSTCPLWQMGVKTINEQLQNLNNIKLVSWMTQFKCILVQTTMASN